MRNSDTLDGGGSEQDRRPVAFLHVPKTGGTTICDWLDRRYSPAEQFACENPGHFLKVAKSAHGHSRLAQARLIRGHFFLSDLLTHSGTVDGAERTIFSIVRSPDAQVMSVLWHFISHRNRRILGRLHPEMEGDIDSADMISAANYFRRDSFGVQASYFVDTSIASLAKGDFEDELAHMIARVRADALKSVHVVGVNEKVRETLQLLCWRMRWPSPGDVGAARFSGAGQVALPDQVRSILRRRLALDNALYESAAERFDRDYGELIRAAVSVTAIDAFLDREASSNPAADKRHGSHDAVEIQENQPMPPISDASADADEEGVIRRRMRLEPSRLEIAHELVAHLTGTGKPIPLDVEEIALLDYVQRYPDRLDLVDRLVEVHQLQGKAVPLAIEERSLQLHLAEQPDRSDLLQRLVAVMVEQGKSVPLALEERALVALLAIADRADLRERLGAVRMAQGKLAPADRVAGASGRFASQTDVDFQQEAEKYDLKSEYGDIEDEFWDLYEFCRSYSMTSVQRLYALYKAVIYIERNSIKGSYAECGVWRGGSIMMILATLMRLGVTDRQIHLFDTFEGLPKPDEDVDVDMFGNRAIDGWVPHARGTQESDWAYASIDDVRKNVALTGYPETNIKYIKGMVETTIPAEAPNELCLLRLDTDWYASTYHEMKTLYPRISTGGVLIIDDYGHFKGARRAVDQYFAETDEAVLLHRIDYSGRMVVKA